MIPYGLLLRLGGVIIALAVLWGGCNYVRALRAEAAQASELRDTLALERSNAELAMKVAAQAAKRERERAAKVKTLEEEVRRAKKPIPHL